MRPRSARRGAGGREHGDEPGAQFVAQRMEVTTYVLGVCVRVCVRVCVCARVRARACECIVNRSYYVRVVFVGPTHPTCAVASVAARKSTQTRGLGKYDQTISLLGRL